MVGIQLGARADGVRRAHPDPERLTTCVFEYHRLTGRSRPSELYPARSNRERVQIPVRAFAVNPGQDFYPIACPDLGKRGANSIPGVNDDRSGAGRIADKQ